MNCIVLPHTLFISINCCSYLSKTTAGFMALVTCSLTAEDRD